MASLAYLCYSLRMRFPIVAGQRFGRLFVIDRDHNPHRKHRASFYECECDCGKRVVVRHDHLRGGLSTSCGCLRNELHRRRLVTHGRTSAPEYGVWSKIRGRCRNPFDAAFDDYGGRDITLDPRWDDFAAFYRDMGPRPSSEHWIERRDNDGPYSPDNCYWATKNEQANNKRNTVWIEYRGRQITLTDAVRLTGFRRKTLRERIRRGWTGEQIIETPVRRRK